MKPWTLFADALVGLALALAPAPAQEPGKILRIGYLRHVPPELDPFRESFHAGLREFGYVDGKNIRIEYRYTGGNPDLLRRHAAELAALPVDIIVTGGTPAVVATAEATRTIPIVVAAIDDPVRAGVAASLARPGRNVTGTSILSGDLSAKRLELLRNAVARTTVVGVLYNAGNESYRAQVAEADRAASALGLQVKFYRSVPAEGFEAVFATIARDGIGALLIVDDGEFVAHGRTLAALALAQKLPTASGLKPFAQAGILLTYGPDTYAGYRRAGYFVDRIVKGGNPANIPFEQTSKVEFAVNLRTARAIGVAIPADVLGRAEEVIE